MSEQPLFYILLDRQTSQLEQQADTGARLNTLYRALTSAVSGSNAVTPLRFTNPANVSSGAFAASLSGATVYAVFTRWDAQFSTGQLQAIHHWVSGSGGKLLLMSNHGPVPNGGNSTNWTQYDAPLAQQFGFTLGPVFIANSTQTTVMSTAMK